MASKSKPKPILTKAEKKAVHRAAFAAAYAADFYDTVQYLRENPERLREGENWWDKAKRVTTGERAYAVADLAVEQYGHWNPKGGAYKLPASCCPDCIKYQKK